MMRMRRMRRRNNRLLLGSRSRVFGGDSRRGVGRRHRFIVLLLPTQNETNFITPTAVGSTYSTSYF